MLVDFRGASAGFSHRNARCFQQRAFSVSGVAPTGLGSRSRRHVSRAHDERRLFGTPRVTACTGPSVEDRAPAQMLMLRVVATVQRETGAASERAVIMPADTFSSAAGPRPRFRLAR